MATKAITIQVSDEEMSLMAECRMCNKAGGSAALLPEGHPGRGRDRICDGCPNEDEISDLTWEFFNRVDEILGR